MKVLINDKRNNSPEMYPSNNTDSEYRQWYIDRVIWRNKNPQAIEKRKRKEKCEHLTYDPAVSVEYLPMRNVLYMFIHSTVIHISPKLEKSQCTSNDRWVYKRIVVYS